MADRQPRFYVPGPVHFFARFPTQSAAQYWGTCELSPRNENTIQYAPVFNTIGGSMVPIQMTDQGSFMRVACLLNRFSISTHNQVKSLISGAGPTATPTGMITPALDRGRLVFGRKTVNVWQIYEYMLNAGYRAGDNANHPLGRYFPNCVVENIIDDPLGTMEEKSLVVMTAYPYWDGPPNGTSRVFQVYSELDGDMAPAISEGYTQ